MHAEFLDRLAELSFPLAFIEEKHGHVHVHLVKSAEGLYKRAKQVEGIANLSPLVGEPHEALRILCAKLKDQGKNVLCTHTPYAIIIEIGYMFDNPNKLAVYVEARKKHHHTRVLGVFRRLDRAEAWVAKQREAGTLGRQYANNPLTKRYRDTGGRKICL